MGNNKIYTISQGLELAKNYASLQERTQDEVVSKLVSAGLSQEEAEEVVAELILQDYINEQRYANLYARSKFNQNNWGKTKIKYGLRAKKISDRCIEEALETIEEKDYLEKCRMVFEKKLKTTKGKNQRDIINKTTRYLYSRGFDYETINIIVQDYENS